MYGGRSRSNALASSAIALATLACSSADASLTMSAARSRDLNRRRLTIIQQMAQEADEHVAVAAAVSAKGFKLAAHPSVARCFDARSAALWRTAAADWGCHP